MPSDKDELFFILITILEYRYYYYYINFMASWQFKETKTSHNCCVGESILQAPRMREVACMHVYVRARSVNSVQLLSHVELFATHASQHTRPPCLSRAQSIQSCTNHGDPMDHNLPGSLSVCVSRQEYGSGLCPLPRDLPNPEIKPASLTSPALEGRFFTTSATWEALHLYTCF